MYSLSQSVLLRGAAGEPIPSPYKGLQKHEVEFRRGEYSLVVAGPGTGKSLFALYLAVSSNIPCMYWSADSNAATQLSRATAMISGDNVKEIHKKLISGDFEEYTKVLGDRWWIRMNFSARPTPADMERDLAAYHEVFGIYPHLIIADNLSDVDTGMVADADNYSFGLEGTSEYLNEVARATNAHVMALHHTVGEFSDGLKPIPLSGVKGKVGRVPSIVLTLHKEADGMGGSYLHVSPVKNRSGFVDASGETFSSYELNSSNLQIKDLGLGDEF